MRSSIQKRIPNKFYSFVAEQIGNSIRKQLIKSKKSTHQKQFSIRKINKLKTQPFNPQQEQKSFWTNPYKTQKQKWNFSYPRKPYIYQKEDIENYKKYDLEKFKHRLKTSLQNNQQSKEYRIKLNHSRVKQIRTNRNQSFQQKTQSSLFNKQYEAELIRRSLYKKKTEAKIQKRKLELQMEFTRWHRQEEKLAKHRNKINYKQHLKTVG